MTQGAVSRSQAKSSGALHYFTGSACRQGHTAARWTRNGECTACAEVRRSDPVKREKYRETARSVYQERRDAILERQRQVREEHPERSRSTQRAYVQRNPEKRRRSQNQYYARNRGRYLEHNRNRERGLKQATPVWADRTAIESVYQKAKGLEVETGLEHHVDHLVPLKGVNSQGEHVVCGLHVHYNLAPIPAAQNRAKSNRFEGAEC